MTRLWMLVSPLLRWLTKNVANRRMMRTAGQAGARVDVIHHVGRRSGTEHATPIVAHPIPGDRYLITLPYGEKVDWCRNVLAAGRARMDIKGESVDVTNPRVVRLRDEEATVPAETMAGWGAWRNWDIACLVVDVRRKGEPGSENGRHSDG